MKVLWAYEPFHQDDKKVFGMYQLLKQLVVSPKNIEVGFIVTRTESDLTLAFDVPLEDRFSLYPRKLVNESLKKSKVPISDEKIHVLDHATFSNAAAVDQLLGLAKTRKSDLIALYTQSSRGFQRLVLGSFAETTVHKSGLNLLLVNPKADLSNKIKNIFFMDDFSPASRKQIKKVIQICRQLKASLTVFHAAEAIYKWSRDESNPKIHAHRRKIDKTQSWIEQECSRASVKCNVIVSQEMGVISKMSLKLAKKNRSDLIVVAAKRGAIASLMGGSITRQVVRESTKPVLVLK